MAKVSVIGSGAWGTALACAAKRAGNSVLLWDHSKEAVEAVNKYHENTVFLPGVPLDANIMATSNILDVLDSDIILLVVPVKFLSTTARALKEAGLDVKKPLVIACKGIEQESLKLVSQIVASKLQNPLAILSGPNFADEVAKGMPAGTTIACEDLAIAEYLSGKLGSPSFRVYYTNDVIGAQIGGAIKNVLAIACGIAKGKGFGENTIAMLITRGTAEISLLCKIKGGNPETILGLCGIGDIMLTCSSAKSRNMSLGLQLGQGIKLVEILKQGKTIEGYHTAKSVHELCKKLNINLPICEAVYAILHGGKEIDDTINELMQRPFGRETYY